MGDLVTVLWRMKTDHGQNGNKIFFKSYKDWSKGNENPSPKTKQNKTKQNLEVSFNYSDFRKSYGSIFLLEHLKFSMTSQEAKY